MKTTAQRLQAARIRTAKLAENHPDSAHYCDWRNNVARQPTAYPPRFQTITSGTREPTTAPPRCNESPTATGEPEP